MGIYYHVHVHAGFGLKSFRVRRKETEVSQGGSMDSSIERVDSYEDDFLYAFLTLLWRFQMQFQSCGLLQFIFNLMNFLHPRTFKYLLRFKT